jgi:four helix bundle protein
MEFEYARSFRELLVYRQAFLVAKQIFGFSKLFPEEEKYALTSQIRRSSRSIGAQNTEGWAKRRYERHFTSKLTDADGEQLETQHWTRVAFSCGYLEESEARSLNCKPRRSRPIFARDDRQSRNILFSHFGGGSFFSVLLRRYRRSLGVSGKNEI